MTKHGMGVMAVCITIFAVISSCASMKLENYRAVSPAVMYKNDFSDGNIEPLNADGLGRSIKLEEGALHFKASNEGEGVHAGFPQYISDGTYISFKLKLGPDNPTGHPSSHINFLWNDNGGRICINFDQGGIGGFMSFPDGSDAGLPQISGSGLSTDVWYDLSFVLLDRKMTIFKNGRKLKTIPLHEQLPEYGRFELECHQDMWIDDLLIQEIENFVLIEES